MIDGKLVWLQAEDPDEDISIALIIWEQFFYLRALQGHSGGNFIDPTLQNNVLIGTGIFPCIHHVGCTFNLHSIINNGFVLGGQDSSRRQTISSCLLIQETQIKNNLNILTSLYHVSRDTCIEHGEGIKTRYFWVDIDLAIKEGFTFYQTRSNAIILQGTLPAHCILNVERLKTGEVLCERRYLCPRPQPKISLKHDHNWTKGNDQSGSTVEHEPVQKLVQQFLGKHIKLDLPSQPNPNLIHLVIQRGNLWSQKTNPVHERLLVNGCKENVVLQIERGNL